MGDSDAFEAIGGFPADILGLDAALLADLYDLLFCFGITKDPSGCKELVSEIHPPLRVLVSVPPRAKRTMVVTIGVDTPPPDSHLFCLRDGMQSLVQWHKGVTVARVRAFIQEMAIRMIEEGCILHGFPRMVIVRDAAPGVTLRVADVFPHRGRIALVPRLDGVDDVLMLFDQPQRLAMLVKATSGKSWICLAEDFETLQPKVAAEVGVSNALARISRERSLTKEKLRTLSDDDLKRIRREATRRAHNKEN